MNTRRNPENYELEDDAALTTKPLTNYDYFDDNDEFMSHHDNEEHDKTVTAKSKPAILKN